MFLAYWKNKGSVFSCNSKPNAHGIRFEACIGKMSQGAKYSNFELFATLGEFDFCFDSEPNEVDLLQFWIIARRKLCGLGFDTEEIECFMDFFNEMVPYPSSPLWKKLVGNSCLTRDPLFSLTQYTL